MKVRLKEHKVGAGLTLREDNLLIASIMPVSLRVHLVEFLVSRNGHVEFAEWITGLDGGYTHKEKRLNEGEVVLLEQALVRLAESEGRLRLDPLHADPSEWESPERVSLRFRHEGKVRRAEWMKEEYFLTHGVEQETRLRYESVFREVLTYLPTEWISQGG